MGNIQGSGFWDAPRVLHEAVLIVQVAVSLLSFTSVYFLGSSYTEGWSGEDFMLERGSQIPQGLF